MRGLVARGTTALHNLLASRPALWGITSAGSTLLLAVSGREGSVDCDACLNPIESFLKVGRMEMSGAVQFELGVCSKGEPSLASRPR